MEHIKDKNLLTIFTYAPAGLGHLRVTDALYDALPKGARHPLLLGSHDEFITFFHRFTSNNPVGRAFFEWTQDGIPEDFATVIYRAFLRLKPRHIYNQLLTILDQRIERPDTILIVATHPSLAHQIAAIKNRFEKEQNIKMYLIVQVTDDSPVHIWYVPEADIMFVPSQYVKDKFIEYAEKSRLGTVNIKVNGYPVSPKLTKERDSFCESKIKQVIPGGEEHIHVMVPLSGAAVGTEYLAHVISGLARGNTNYRFHIVAQLSLRAVEFLNRLSNIKTIDLHISPSTREVVNDYEMVYRRNPIAFEITKPSEQSFKALLKPGQVGGSILLFTHPVGRWEHDNLAFLRRHHLIPSEAETHRLQHGNGKGELERIYKDAGDWRGLRLPDDPEEAITFFHKLMDDGIFMRMMNCDVTINSGVRNPEIDSHGAERLWTIVDELLGDR